VNPPEPKGGSGKSKTQLSDWLAALSQLVGGAGICAWNSKMHITLAPDRAGTRERRSYRRYELRLPALVWRRRRYRCSVITVNISSRGVLFIAERDALHELEPGDPLLMEVDLATFDRTSTKVVLQGIASVVRMVMRPNPTSLMEVAARFRTTQVVRREVGTNQVIQQTSGRLQHPVFPLQHARV
jgi:hypothetical protein